jgi:hypothetical protein
VTPEVTAGLLQLLKADGYAREVRRLNWDFAVEIENLRAAGLTNGDLRWLACKGYVEHAVETTPAGSETRRFGAEGELTFGLRSCFVLTEAGAAFVRRLAGRARDGAAGAGNGTGRRAGPDWAAACRVLRVRGKVVKRFQVPAENQELILTRLQQLDWQRHIDDPLPRVSGLNPKRRLEDTISRLNKNQQNRLIRFHGDGTGRGLWWELLG